MSSLNKAQIIGNVGKDPEIRSTQSGSKIANLTIATSERWKDKQTGEQKEQTEWHKVTIFNENLVRIVEQYVKKGSKIYVEGAIKTRKWTDKDGQDRYSTEITLAAYGGQIVLLSAKDGGSAPASQAAPQQQQAASTQSYLDDEIPF